MKSRGLQITDEAAVETALRSINYYRLSGYLHDFKKPGSDLYIDGLTWERLKAIYDFDRRFTRLLLFVLEDIEETLKTRVSYTLSCTFPKNPLVYKDPSLFRNTDIHTDFLSRIETSVKNNKELPFVKHHLDEYEGNLPIWVAIELFTMGNLHSFYDNLIPTHQKAIAKTYDTGAMQMKNWIKSMSYTRNHIAHNMRLYHLNFGRSPLSCKKHSRTTRNTNMIYDQIFVMSVMYSDLNEWNNYVLPEMQALFDQYGDQIILADLGFPSNWKEELTRSE